MGKFVVKQTATGVKFDLKAGNGEPILFFALPYEKDSEKHQKPARKVECSVRNVQLDGITCFGENAMGVIGQDGNIRDVTLSRIVYERKPSPNMDLKGYEFDVAPSHVRAEAPEGSGLVVRGAENVRLQDVDTGTWTVITE